MPRWSVFAAAGVSIAAAAPSARADGLHGAGVSVAGYCCTAPVEGNRFTNKAGATVSAALEFPVGALYPIGALGLIPLSIDVSSFSVQARYMTTITAAPGSFNGVLLEFTAARPILDVRVNTASTVNPVGIAFNANSIAVNLASIAFTPTSTWILDVQTAAVPEPAASALLVAGGLALWPLLGRRSARTRAVDRRRDRA